MRSYRVEGVVRLDGQEIVKNKSFQYLESLIYKDGEIEEDVNYRIRARWMKWRSVLGILFDCRISIKLKGKFYNIAI